MGESNVNVSPRPVEKLPTLPALPSTPAAAVALLDRCAALGYQPRQDAAHVAACVALAAEREGMPLDLASLAAQLGQMQGAGGDPEAALQGEMQAAVAALQGDTSCLTGACREALVGRRLLLAIRVGLCLLCRIPARPPAGRRMLCSPACWPASSSAPMHPPRPTPARCAAVHCWKVFADRMQCNVEDDAQVGSQRAWPAAGGMAHAPRCGSLLMPAVVLGSASPTVVAHVPRIPPPSLPLCPRRRWR